MTDAIKVWRGDDLYNRKEDKMGVVMDMSNLAEIKVLTVSGTEYWNLDDCTVMERD